MTLPNEPMKFQFHAGTMRFLTKNNFDFNKLFYDSVPYTRKDNLKIFKNQANTIKDNDELKDSKWLNSFEVRDFLSSKEGAINAWMEGSDESIEVDIQRVKYQAYMSLKRKVEERFPDQSFLVSFDCEEVVGRSKMVIKKCRSEEKSESEGKKESEKAGEMFFNEVIDSIVDSKKPLILHNGFLDMMHIYLRFMGDLPATWTDYRK